MAAGVPDQLWLVESFLNSVDVDSGQDDLDSVDRFRRWLRDHGREAAAGPATGEDLALARELRAGLRDQLHAHGHGTTSGWSALDVLAARVPLRARFADGAVGLGPAAAGVAGMLGEVLAAIALADRDGIWRRLKLCREETCQVVFYDRSKNGSRCWCSMEVCGNRNKTRAYRSRLRDLPA
jgi:predicted RNA-binding Zn ribbon-like protein